MPTAALRHSNINPLQFVPQQDYANETALCFIWWEQIGGFVYRRPADTFPTGILKLVGAFKSMISFTFGRSPSLSCHRNENKSQEVIYPVSKPGDLAASPFLGESAHRTDLVERRIRLAVVYSYDPPPKKNGDFTLSE